jgi:hypothetical protein
VTFKLSGYFIKGQGAMTKKCAWIVIVCYPKDVDPQAVAEVPEELSASIGMAELSKIFFPHTPHFYHSSLLSYYSQFSLFLTYFFFFNNPEPRNSEWISQS